MDIERELILTQSLTDLAAGVLLLIIIGVIAFKRTEKEKRKKCWITFFSCFAISNILGFIAHYYCKSELSFKLIWIPLYAVMYETANTFFFLLQNMKFSDRPGIKEKRVIYLVSVAVYAVTIVVDLIFDISAIRLLALYAVVIALYGLSFIFKSAFKRGHSVETLICCTLFPLIPGAVFQFYKIDNVKLIWHFEHNGLTHLCVIVSILIFFAAAFKELYGKEQIK